MGFHSSNDTYTKKFNDITVDVKWSNHCVDDTLLWDDSIEASFWHVVSFVKSRKFYWDDALDALFEKSKAKIVTDSV